MKSLYSLISTLILLASAGQFSMAQSSYTWNGGGGNDNMSNSGNWSGGTPAGSEYINFAGGTRLTPTNDLSATSRYQIYFNSGASAFTVGGSTNNPFYDYGGNRPKIENNSSNAQTINFPFTIGNSVEMELNPVTSNLIFGGSITMNSGNNIRVYGNNNHNLYLNGGLSGTGKLSTFQNSNVYIQSACSYSGNTELDGNGDMYIESGGSLGSSHIRISSGSSFNVNSNVTVPSIAERGVSNGGTISIANSQILTVNGANAGTLFQNSISGAGGITMAGSGTTVLSLYGTQSFTGPIAVSGGKISSSVALSSTSLSCSGGTLEFTAADIVSNSATVTVSGSGTVDFQQNETINNLTLNGGTLNIAAGKTLTINGTLRIEAAATINLNGTGVIAYGIGANLEFATGGSITTANSFWPSSSGPDNLTVTTSGTAVTMHAARTISGTLTLTAGTINLDAYNLTLGSSATISGTPSWGSSTSSYLIAEASGKLIRTVTTSATLFPIGTASTYLPIRLALSSASGSFEINLVTPTGLTDATYTLNKIWEITGSGTTDMEMQWPESMQGSNFPTSGVTYLKKTGSTWSDLGQSASRSGSNPYTISFSNINCCSQFVPGGSQALPVELLNFSATANGANEVLIQWSTASEYNNHYFEIYRSVDGLEFAPVQRVEAKGQLAATTYYEAADHHNLAQCLYLLKQVDYDGTTADFGPVIMRREASKRMVDIVPNPIGLEGVIRINSGDASMLDLTILNANGQTIYSRSEWPVAEVQLVDLMPLGLTPGYYIALIRLDRWTERMTFIR